ncbi:hypothetical protein TG4357_03035 [Thalassovita gelatinovora]|uniref:Uncharacterized protein n=1 Tax=Thalassovita gelatinovora TaxID=53501 RepID=A0A0P1FHN9_THAGE|nr:hypothetical protein TG4357_03035 [Thalassovita gelatinovora]
MYIILKQRRHRFDALYALLTGQMCQPSSRETRGKTT